MEKASKYQVLDIGGGPDWLPNHGHGDWLLESMRNLRAARLARENPNTTYIVLDQYIPGPETEVLLRELPNLHFVEHKIANLTHLPFPNNSVERVEMNHMWTPLTAIPTEPGENEIKGIPGAADYLQVLRESCRVLKTGGILSITEKEDRLNKVRIILSKNSDLDLDGIFMQELGLDMAFETHNLTQVTYSDRSQYTKYALEQGVKVYCLELKKI